MCSRSDNRKPSWNLARGKNYLQTQWIRLSKPDVSWPLRRVHNDFGWRDLAIALPTQSITIDKDAAIPTTKRKLAFDDLVSHIKHYNANTRRGLWLRTCKASWFDSDLSRGHFRVAGVIGIIFGFDSGTVDTHNKLMHPSVEWRGSYPRH